jgi:hypothetical protein
MGLQERGYLGRKFLIAAMAVATLVGPALQANAQTANDPRPNDTSSHVDQQPGATQVSKPWASDANYQREIQVMQKKRAEKIANAEARAKEDIAKARADQLKKAAGAAGAADRTNSRRGGADILDWVVVGGRAVSDQARLEAKISGIEMKLDAKLIRIDADHEKAVDRLDDRYEAKADKAEVAAYKAQKAAADKAAKAAERDATAAKREQAKEDAKDKKASDAQEKKETQSQEELDKMHRDAMRDLYKNHVKESVKNGQEPLEPEAFFAKLAQERAEKEAAEKAAPQGPQQAKPAAPGPK